VHVAGVPIPEADAAEGARVEAAITQALQDADARGLKGAAVTPFLLDRVQRLTGGASLAANIRLVKNNARVGSAIAVALAQTPGEGEGDS
jgi:pseudouridylate synthase